MGIRMLYGKYGNEIAEFRPTMRAWCKRSKCCKFCDYEVEMLYMLIREYKPQKVFEMAPNQGYSSHWILHALHRNDATSTLHSIDLHGGSKNHMDPSYKSRWFFTQADYAKQYDKGKLIMDDFDFIFIDALHEPAFSRGYCERLLSPHKRKAIVAIHDIVATEIGNGRESSEVYKYMAFDNKVRNVFTMSRYTMPNLYHPIKDAINILNQIRAEQHIITPCIPDSTCNDPMHDLLDFQNNDSPTIFFQLN